MYPFSRGGAARPKPLNERGTNPALRHVLGLKNAVLPGGARSPQLAPDQNPMRTSCSTFRCVRSVHLVAFDNWNGTSARSVVPVPGLDSIVRRPPIIST